MTQYCVRLVRAVVFTTLGSAAGVMQEDEANQPAHFYDNWVTRDINGDLFSMAPPYASDPHSRQRISRGLHFPVKCCWNGMVALNAAPFLRHGVRIRCMLTLVTPVAGLAGCSGCPWTGPCMV